MSTERNLSPEAHELAMTFVRELSQSLVDVAMGKTRLKRAIKARFAVKRITAAVLPLLEHIEKLEAR